MVSSLCEGWPTPPSMPLEGNEVLVHQWVTADRVVCLLEKGKNCTVGIFERINGAVIGKLFIGSLCPEALNSIKNNAVPLFPEIKPIEFKPLSGDRGLRIAGPWPLDGGRVSVIKDHTEERGSYFRWLLELPRASTSWKVPYCYASRWSPNSNYLLQEERRTNRSWLHDKWNRFMGLDSFGVAIWANDCHDVQDKKAVLERANQFVPFFMSYDSADSTFPMKIRFRNKGQYAESGVSESACYVHPEESAITLVNSDPKHWHGHALILIERIGEHGYEMWKAHLVGDKGCTGISDGHVCLAPVEDPKRFLEEQVAAKTETWIRPATKVNELFKKIKCECQDQRLAPVIRFCPYGRDSLAASLRDDGDVRPIHSCITYACEKLSEVDICLGKSRLASVITLPKEYTQPGAKVERPSSLPDFLIGLGGFAAFTFLGAAAVAASLFTSSGKGEGSRIPTDDDSRNSSL